MKRSDITDRMVCEAYAIKNADPFGWRDMADVILIRLTGASRKVAYAAMERAERNGFIESGVSLRSGWLTDKGRELLADA